jgi:hypothetical protein
MLSPGRDYLFFEKVDCSQQSLTATMTRGAVVMTPNLIAMIPVQSTGSVLVATIATRYKVSGGDPVAAVKALLADPAMDVATLEATLHELYAGSKTRWLFPIAELETFTMKTGFFGMTSVKVKGESVRRIVIRDKGGKAAAKAFYGR